MHFNATEVYRGNGNRELRKRLPKHFINISASYLSHKKKSSEVTALVVVQAKVVNTKKKKQKVVQKLLFF